MFEVICSRSGLKFQSESKRVKVHPKIGYWTSHKDMTTRHTAVRVIESGKSEKWDTYEKFQEEIHKAIHKALNPEPEPRPEFDFEGAWVAEIIGSHPKYRFSRKFIKKVDKEGRHSRFVFPDTGIFECCYKSSKGNETRSYVQVVDGIRSKITLEEIEALFPAIQKFSGEGMLRVAENLGTEGDIIKYQGVWYFIAHVDLLHCWEDEDGVIGDGPQPSDTRVVREWVEVEDTYLRPATPEEIELAQASNGGERAVHQKE